MIFKVEKLGPVERAEIDLSKDLILLTGLGRVRVSSNLARAWRLRKAVTECY
jgi:hypothetical protein